MKFYISPVRSTKQVKIIFSKSDEGSSLSEATIFNKGYRITHKNSNMGKILNTVHKIMRNF